MSAYEAERREVLIAVQRIVESGLVAGSSGNVSRRIPRAEGDLVAVSASRVPYHRFSIDDVLVVDFDVEPVVGDGLPSSESLTHMAVYGARPDVGAVIHTHSVHASAFAVAGTEIPAVLDEQVVLLGGPVAVADYAPSASTKLANNAARALGDRAAVLLRNHGVLGVGRDLEEAASVVELVERVAQICIAAAAIGGAQALPAEVTRAESAVYRMMRGMREA